MPRCIGNTFGSRPHSKLSLQAPQVPRKSNGREHEYPTTSLLGANRDAINRAVCLSVTCAGTDKHRRTVLAVTSLPSGGNVPLFFKLSRVELPPGQTSTCSEPVGFLYALSGALT